MTMLFFLCAPVVSWLGVALLFCASFSPQLLPRTPTLRRRRMARKRLPETVAQLLRGCCAQGRKCHNNHNNKQHFTLSFGNSLSRIARRIRRATTTETQTGCQIAQHPVSQ